MPFCVDDLVVAHNLFVPYRAFVHSPVCLFPCVQAWVVVDICTFFHRLVLFVIWCLSPFSLIVVVVVLDGLYFAYMPHFLSVIGRVYSQTIWLPWPVALYLGCRVRVFHLLTHVLTAWLCGIHLHQSALGVSRMHECWFVVL